MPSGRKSKNGGGLGGSLVAKRWKRRIADPTKADRTRVNPNDSGISTVKDFIDASKSKLSCVDPDNLEDYFAQSLIPQTHSSLSQKDGKCWSNFHFYKQYHVVDNRFVDQPLFPPNRPPGTSIPLPERPYPFHNPINRVLRFAQYLGQLAEDEANARKSGHSESHSAAPKIVDHPHPVTSAANATPLTEEQAIRRALTVTDTDLFVRALEGFFSERENITPFLSADELEREEMLVFAKWRKQVGLLEQQSALIITPFEKNPEYWKQLWRTLERSDIVLGILDARNPLLFRSRAYEELVRDYGKRFIVLMNKTDYLTRKQRQEWKQYFDSQNVEVIFYSAIRELKKQSVKLSQKDIVIHDYVSLRTMEDDSHCLDCDQLLATLTERGKSLMEEKNARASLADEVYGKFLTLSEAIPDKVEVCRRILRQVRSLLRNNETEPRPNDEEAECPNDEEVDCDDTSSTDECDELDVQNAAKDEQACEGNNETSSGTASDLGESPKQNLDAVIVDEQEEEVIITKAMKKDIQNKFLSLLLGPRESLKGNERLHIGTTGFPNVGKSTIVNTLLQGSKRVGVSRTPGKTRHLQTLDIPNTNITLCDCPGLIFPIIAKGKEDLVINNIVSADTYRGSLIKPVSFMMRKVADRIGDVYGVSDEVERIRYINGDRDVSKDTLTIVTRIAELKKFTSGGKGGVPDVERTCRILLKMFAEGVSISYCEPPPSANRPLWIEEEERKRLAARLTKIV